MPKQILKLECGQYADTIQQVALLDATDYEIGDLLNITRGAAAVCLPGAVMRGTVSRNGQVTDIFEFETGLPSMKIEI